MKTAEEWRKEWEDKPVDLSLSDVELEAEFDTYIRQIQNDAIEAAAKIVHDEPNLPGEMPDSFYTDVTSSKSKATSMFRATVAVTMDSIKQRILNLRNQEKAKE